MPMQDITNTVDVDVDVDVYPKTICKRILVETKYGTVFAMDDSVPLQKTFNETTQIHMDNLIRNWDKRIKIYNKINGKYAYEELYYPKYPPYRADDENE